MCPDAGLGHTPPVVEMAVAPYLAWSRAPPAARGWQPGLHQADGAPFDEACLRKLRGLPRWRRMQAEVFAQVARLERDGAPAPAPPGERALVARRWKIGRRELSLQGLDIGSGASFGPPIGLDEPAVGWPHQSLWGLFDVTDPTPRLLIARERSWPGSEADQLLAVAAEPAGEVLLLFDERRPTRSAYEKRAVLRYLTDEAMFDVPYGRFCPEDRD